jgi:hypothetical protein
MNCYSTFSFQLLLKMNNSMEAKSTLEIIERLKSMIQELKKGWKVFKLMSHFFECMLHQ